MNITAIMVQKVRELTDANLMECKRALVGSNGDIDKAAELIRTRSVPSFEELKVVALEHRVARLEKLLERLID